MPDKGVSLIEAAAITGYSVGHLRKLAKAGILPAWRRGPRLILVDRAALDEFVKPL